ncbi:hypothetical protein HUX88_16925 [Duganella sp. BJB1802]|uniref:PhaM family polyhydroxyalkanoate granule multifunctional regulatory protein n=1 Tax=Duganella sp. BJB1802 TaxID=2744575 RepID=UPI0015948B14|nr:PhaM family polyhydroxyalkanoate granule multifunctional regulatory protein [Duganella sp. BJB1802]NVD72221.1 hypothetical protein [Duganella sp. BJB1802]
MAHPQMPNIPGAAVMTDTLDFVKSLWGSMSVPGLTAPTLSVEELDKKINDLKAVETWLNLNMSMLRGSIQALEVQRGTIATLKSVGASLAAAVNQPQSNDHKSIFDANPYASAFFHHAREADKDKDKAPAPAAAPAAPAAPAAAAEKPAAEEAAKPSAAPMTNPAIWWNMLQDQFKQAVSTAMASESMMATAAARATDTAAKFAAAATQPAAKAKPAAAATPATASAAPKKAPAKKRAPVKKAAADKA